MWQAIMELLASNALVDLVAAGLIWWALWELFVTAEGILNGILIEDEDNWDEEGGHNVQEVWGEDYEEGEIDDEEEQAEEVEIESEYEESVQDVEENENSFGEERENISGGYDGNDYLSEEWKNHGSDFHFSTVVSLPVAIVSPLIDVVDVRNILAGALREAAPELRLSTLETEETMKRIHRIECQRYLQEEREQGLQEHHWSSCKLYLRHDLVNKYFQAVKSRVSPPRRT